MDGSGTDDDDTLERHADTNKLTGHTEEAEKRRQRKSATSQPAAGSHGSLFLSTSLNFHTVNILSLRARGELCLWRRSKLAQIR